jgi:MoxR-like ATPase
LIDRLLVGCWPTATVLLEGVPGLAKTLSVRTLAAAIQPGSIAFSSPQTSSPPTSPAR